jgi:hypothetical protein
MFPQRTVPRSTQSSVFEQACRSVWALRTSGGMTCAPPGQAGTSNKGTPLMVFKELGGWETLEMVQKDAHLAPSQVTAHANTVKSWSRLDRGKTPLVRTA